MGVVTFVDDFTSPIPAERLFKALILDADNLIPKIMPNAIKNVELLQGNGGPGSIKKMNFAEGSPQKYIKNRIDSLDTEKMTYQYTVIEGDALGDKLESIAYDIKLEALPEGGCKGKTEAKYNTKPGTEVKEEELKADKEKAVAVYKAVEAFLTANPNEYA